MKLKQYKYKINWLFSDIKEVKKILKILHVRGLDKIVLRDTYYKVIDETSDFIMYEENRAIEETIKYIKLMKRKNKHICFIELVRK
jgi:archaellum biogenesis ATPase FlaH